MNFEEYKITFEEILKISEVIEELCKQKKFDALDKPFNEREKLFEKLELPSDLTEEQLNCIMELRDKIQAKNDFLVRAIKAHKLMLKQEILHTKQENKIINAYTIPKGDNKSSIFDSKE